MNTRCGSGYGAKVAMYCYQIENRGDPLVGDIDELSRLFQSTKSSATNFGLGLYIARKIAQAHGGDIAAEPLESPDGARFYCEASPLQRAN